MPAQRFFELRFDMENDAFQGGDGPLEVARILREIANNVVASHYRTDFQVGTSWAHIRDINGNTVGKWGVGFRLPPPANVAAQ